VVVDTIGIHIVVEFFVDVLVVYLWGFENTVLEQLALYRQEGKYMIEEASMVHVKIVFGGIGINDRRSMHQIDVSSENYMCTINDLIRHRLNINGMLAIDILMQNPQSGLRGLVQLNSRYSENMELGRLLMDFDEDVHSEVMIDREDLYVTIRTRSDSDMPPVVPHVQDVSVPLPISAAHFASAVSRQSMSHLPYAVSGQTTRHRPNT